MLKRILSIFLALFVTVSLAQPPKNFKYEQQQLRHYVNSGNYNRELQRQVDKAMNILKNELKNIKKNQKPAIILDIDETALSNMRQLKEMWSLPNTVGDTIPESDLNKADDMFHDPAIKPVLEFYRYAIKHGVTVFFITGRYNEDRIATTHNLHHVGYKKFKALIMRMPNQRHETAVVYKTHARKKITAEGYTILLNVGDQFSDIHGGYSKQTVKLPNPFYFTP